MDVDETGVLFTIIEQIEEINPDLTCVFYEMQDFYERKLWYQLSQTLKDYIYKESEFQPIRLKLYDNFISTFYDKINQLEYVEFLIKSLSDVSPSDALEYLNTAKDNISQLGERRSKKSGDENINDHEIIQASIIVDLELAKIKLQLGFVDEASSIIDSSENKLNDLTCSIDLRVNASFYFAKAQMSKKNGDFNSFYYNSLLFLACVDDLNTLSNKEEIVKDICISGILGDKIYNFGEIIMHDILNYLKIEWLKDLLVAINNGDLENFKSITSSQSNKLNEVTEIQANLSFINQKMCIMSFIEMVFNKPSNSKAVKYNEILKEIPLLENNNEVEYLVMKCLSLGLIKGVINQVQQEVEVSWIQPRTMTLAQVENMKGKLATWTKTTEGLYDYMKQAGAEVYV